MNGQEDCCRVIDFMLLSFTPDKELQSYSYCSSNLQNGWCGDTPDHCDGTTFQPTITPSAPPILPIIITPLPAKEPTPAPITSNPTKGPITANPTPALVSKDYSAITPGQSKFCGPKYVGGYNIAKSNCSYETECGKVSGETHYGATGNDCPNGLMCYTDIVCVAPADPTESPSVRPTVSPTVSMAPTFTGQTPSPTLGPTTGSPTQDPTLGPTVSPTKAPTRNPTMSPSISPTKQRPPTVPPMNLQNIVTARGSYCGASIQTALNQCSPSTFCSNGSDCENNEECIPNISCTFHASEANKDGEETESDDEEEEIDEGDDVYETEFAGNEFGEEYVPEEIISAAMAKKLLFGWWVGTMIVVAFVDTLLV